MDGLILVDKPMGCTSHDIVHSLRRILNIKKIGHFGTLDPLAEGLLLIGVGKATRLFPYLSKTLKIYEGSIRLGLTTDTYDREGTITSQYEGPLPKKENVEQAMSGFIGDLQQVPPPYSAKKYKGQPLYVFARKNQPVPLKASPVKVFSFQITDYSQSLFRFSASCSSGTYIRSLAHDLGAILGCGACLDSLKRTGIGDYRLEDAATLEKIELLTEKGLLGEFLQPMESLLTEYPSVVLNDRETGLVKHGNSIPLHAIDVAPPPFKEPESNIRLFDREGQLIALGAIKKDGEEIHPFLVFMAE
jgi:tRNA pseudouridine55 synthase